MKAFYYPLLRKHFLVGMPAGIAYRLRIAYLLVSLLLGVQVAQAQFGSDLGSPAISTLAWDHISSYDSHDSPASGSIGITRNNQVYTWGTNVGYTINAQRTTTGLPVNQLAPYYVSMPTGEVPTKVRFASGGYRFSYYLPTYFCLTASGKIYAWGFNSGLAGNAVAGFPIVSSAPAGNDTTKAVRTPKLISTIGTDTTFVDMDFGSNSEFGVIIGESGKAYHIGYDGKLDPATTYYTSYAAIPNPTGVTGSFKYTAVWVSKFTNFNLVYLKGNDGNIYYTGPMGEAGSLGVPSLYFRNSPIPTTTTAESQGRVRSIVPRFVPFPAGENIIDISTYNSDFQQSTYAISASGKAYIAGLWRVSFTNGGVPGEDFRQYVVAPLKSEPPANQIDVYYYNAGEIDTAYVLKQFCEIAMPQGASRVLSIARAHAGSVGSPNLGTLMVVDNNRVYWSGAGHDEESLTFYIGNYLMPTQALAPPGPDFCNTVSSSRTNSYYTWTYEAINYRGAAKLFPTSRLYRQLGIIARNGRGYFVGRLSANTASGKMISDGYLHIYTSPYPVPIANEQLLSCNTSPGTGGPLGEPVSTPGVGVIDCSKTKLYPAPVQGTPSELSLLVTINVTTVGDFSPITISGSGMSLVSGFDKVTATTTGIQTFHIPIKYDGSTLTNNFQFTIGQAGSCSADLTNKPSNEITRVWSLNNCSAITPGVLSK